MPGYWTVYILGISEKYTYPTTGAGAPIGGRLLLAGQGLGPGTGISVVTLPAQLQGGQSRPSLPSLPGTPCVPGGPGGPGGPARQNIIWRGIMSSVPSSVLTLRNIFRTPQRKNHIFCNTYDHYRSCFFLASDRTSSRQTMRNKWRGLARDLLRNFRTRVTTVWFQWTASQKTEIRGNVSWDSS